MPRLTEYMKFSVVYPESLPSTIRNRDSSENIDYCHIEAEKIDFGSNSRVTSQATSLSLRPAPPPSLLSCVYNWALSVRQHHSSITSSPTHTSLLTRQSLLSPWSLHRRSSQT